MDLATPRLRAWFTSICTCLHIRYRPPSSGASRFPYDSTIAYERSRANQLLNNSASEKPMYTISLAVPSNQDCPLQAYQYASAYIQDSLGRTLLRVHSGSYSERTKIGAQVEYRCTAQGVCRLSTVMCYPVTCRM